MFFIAKKEATYEFQVIYPDANDTCLLAQALFIEKKIESNLFVTEICKGQ